MTAHTTMHLRLFFGADHLSVERCAPMVLPEIVIGGLQQLSGGGSHLEMDERFGFYCVRKFLLLNG